MPFAPRLWHFTANTGHIFEASRDQVDQSVIDHLLPVVDAQRGDMVRSGFGIDIMRPRDRRGHRLPGAAYFQVGPAGERMTAAPYLMAVACWRADREASAWRQFKQVVKVGSEAWRRHPKPLVEPPDIPWLASYLLPTSTALPRTSFLVLSGLERCLA
jgi:hypothetical protein